LVVVVGGAVVLAGAVRRGARARQHVNLVRAQVGSLATS
jgi:hypothetical protein